MPEGVSLPVLAQVSRAPVRPPASALRRARRLAGLGVAWHAVEALVAVGAGLIAGSVALVGFGADSLVEGLAGVVVVWRLGSSRVASQRAERRAQRLIGASFAVIAVYVSVEAVRTLTTARHPEVSLIGIGLSAFTLLVMPPLARAKARVAHRLGSSATASEGRQNMLCAYLSGALLVGLAGNAVAGWWWADPLVALLIAGVAMREAGRAWRGEHCGCCPAPPG